MSSDIGKLRRHHHLHVSPAGDHLTIPTYIDLEDFGNQDLSIQICALWHFAPRSQSAGRTKHAHALCQVKILVLSNDLSDYA